MVWLVLVASYFSLVDSRNLSSGNAFPRVSSDYFFMGSSVGFHMGTPGVGNPLRKHIIGSDLTLRIYKTLVRASLFKGKSDDFYDEAMELCALYPIMDSIFISGGLRTSYSSDYSLYTPGFSLKVGAYFAGPSGDLGVGLLASRDSAAMAVAELGRRFRDNLRWGFAYSGGMKSSSVATCLRFGEVWGFALSGGGSWIADSSRVFLWPGLGVDYQGRDLTWNLFLRYDRAYGERQPIFGFGITVRKPYSVDTSKVLAQVPVELLPGAFGTTKNPPGDEKETKPQNHSSGKNPNKASEPGKKDAGEERAQAPKASSEEIETLYLKGVEAYRWEDFATAVYYWEQVLKLDPNHVKAKRGIERAKKYLEE